jgi:hypothetical protein
VLTESNMVNGHSVGGSDVMLVDYGRSIDLSAVEQANNPSDAGMGTMLLGAACPEEMMCVAMRQGLPWSFDADTFGICASAHVLLFGSHLEIAVNENKRWMPRETLHNDLQIDLWTYLFDTLLNLDDVTKGAIGSRPHSLRQLRTRIEECLASQQGDFLTALQHQATILSSMN